MKLRMLLIFEVAGSLVVFYFAHKQFDLHTLHNDMSTNLTT
jgi:hypothetical protein